MNCSFLNSSALQKLFNKQSIRTRKITQNCIYDVNHKQKTSNYIRQRVEEELFGDWIVVTKKRNNKNQQTTMVWNCIVLAREGSCSHIKVEAQRLVINSQEHEQNVGNPMTE